MRSLILVVIVLLNPLSCRAGGGQAAGGANVNPNVALPPPETPAGQARPAPLGGLADIVAGDRRTCAVTTGGAVLCWGINPTGQLGFLSTTTCRYDSCAPVPTAVPFLSQIVQVALPVGSDANRQQSCARTRNGEAICWDKTPDPRAHHPGEPAPAAKHVRLPDVVDVAVGGEHACVVKKDGHVLCWGMNGAGQLGYKTTRDCRIFTGESSYTVECSGTPKPVVDLVGVVSLALGNDHSCARKSDGTVACWGQNAYGQLGDGTTTYRVSPAPVTGLDGVEQLTAAADHACARKKDGSIWCWGLAEEGRLGSPGDKCTTPSLPGWPRSCLRTPRPVPGVTAVEVRAGRQHTCARRADGAIICWGDNSDGALGSLPRAKELPPTVLGTFAGASGLTTGDRHTCVRKGDGTAVCLGENTHGQLGDGTQIPHDRPAEVLATARHPARLTGVVEIRTGATHTCARTVAGAVLCWGTNDTQGPVANVATEVLPAIDAPGSKPGGKPGDKITGLSVGDYHACANQAGGTVVCWGDNSYRQLGSAPGKRSDRPVPCAGVTAVTALAAGGDHTCARTDRGKVVCWGRNGHGQLGVAGVNSVGPIEVPGLDDVAQLESGGQHTCALRRDGTVVCWGANYAGQIGVAFGSDPRPPTVVPGVTGATAIAAGEAHTCALRKDGVVLCWGGDQYGELGYPSATRCGGSDVCSGAAAPARNLPDAVEISAGRGFTCARTRRHELYCWGNNQDGNLGDGTRQRRPTPDRVQHLSAVEQVATGAAHTCARKTDGTAWCWGSNDRGQLGDASTSHRFFPWPVLR